MNDIKPWYENNDIYHTDVSIDTSSKKDYTIQTVYSDRLYQWDSEKFNTCCELVWGNRGQHFDKRTKSSIEQFLSLYMDKNVEVVYIEPQTGYNGYTVWRFDYKEII